MIKLSDRQDIIGYMSWCEATGNSPFGEDEDDYGLRIDNYETTGYRHSLSLGVGVTF